MTDTTHTPTLVEAFDRAVAAHGTKTVIRTLHRGEQIGLHWRWLDQSFWNEIRQIDDREQQRQDARARRMAKRMAIAAGLD